MRLTLCAKRLWIVEGRQAGQATLRVARRGASSTCSRDIPQPFLCTNDCNRSARMPAADTTMEEEVARRAALATKGVRQNKSKGTPAALRKRSEAFAQKTIVHKGVAAKSSVRARASSSSGGNGGGVAAAFSREIAAAGSRALVGDVRVGLAAHPRPPPRDGPAARHCRCARLVAHPRLPLCCLRATLSHSAPAAPRARRRRKKAARRYRRGSSAAFCLFSLAAPSRRCCRRISWSGSGAAGSCVLRAQQFTAPLLSF
jgi:hypothetical protein